MWGLNFSFKMQLKKWEAQGNFQFSWFSLQQYSTEVLKISLRKYRTQIKYSRKPVAPWSSTEHRLAVQNADSTVEIQRVRSCYPDSPYSSTEYRLKVQQRARILSSSSYSWTEFCCKLSVLLRYHSASLYLINTSVDNWYPLASSAPKIMHCFL